MTWDWNGLSDRLAVDELIRNLNVRMPRASRALRQFPTDFIDIRRFDVSGDGLRDDTAGVQAWLNESADTGIAYLSTGRYRLTSTLTIPSNVEIVGANWNATLFFDWITASQGSVYMENVDTTNGNSNIRLRDLSIEGQWPGGPLGNPGNRCSGILFRRGANIEVRHCQIWHVPGISLAHQGISNFQAIGNWVHDGGRDGITGGPYGTSPSDDVTVALNHVLDCHDDHIACNMSVDTANPGTTPPRRWRIIGNAIRGGASLSADNFARGIMVHGGEDILIGLNDVQDTSWMTLLVLIDPVTAQRPAGIAVIGNRLRNAGRVGTNLGGHGARLDGIDGLTFVGNEITDANDYGIFMTDCNGWKAHDNAVERCGQSLGAVGFGVWLSGTSAAARDVTNGQFNDNRVAFNYAAGVYAKHCDQLDLHHNKLYNNGQAASNDTANAGLLIEGGGVIRAHGNAGYDDQGSKTQRYGIVSRFTAPDYVSLKDNELQGNLTQGYLENVSPTLIERRGNHLTTGASSGRAALVNGTVTVNTPEVQASDNLTLTRVVAAGTTQGILRVATITPGTSFVTESTDLAGALSADDDSTVFWEIIH